MNLSRQISGEVRPRRQLEWPDSLPKTTLPTDSHCGYDTHLRSTRIPVRDLPVDEQRMLHTVDRWVIVTHWQCDVRPEHSGAWFVTTDDAGAEIPYRTVDDPAARQIQPWLKIAPRQGS